MIGRLGLQALRRAFRSGDRLGTALKAHLAVECLVDTSWEHRAAGKAQNVAFGNSQIVGF
jgi:hypothetical protein